MLLRGARVVVPFAACAAVVSLAHAGPALSGAGAVVTVPGAARALSAADGRIAWIGADWRLYVLRLASGRQTAVQFTQKRYVNPDDPFAEAPELAFAGSHPVWGDARGRPEVLQSVYTNDARGRLHAVARLRHYGGAGGGAGDYLLSIAGDAAGGAFSWGHEELVGQGGGRTTAGGVWTLADGIKRRVPNLPPAWALARSGTRLALAPVRADEDDVPLPETDPSNPQVELATVTGKLIARFRAKYDVQSVALTPRYVFVEEAQEDGSHGGIEIRSALTGRLLRWLPGKGGPYLSASGGHVVFWSFSKVFSLDGATGKITQVAVVPAARSHVVGAVLDGDTVYWGTATKTPHSRGDADDPADFTTTIHERRLTNGR
jgi:hypothetical protein